jgi:hypothetical protein
MRTSPATAFVHLHMALYFVVEATGPESGSGLLRSLREFSGQRGSGVAHPSMAFSKVLCSLEAVLEDLPEQNCGRARTTNSYCALRTVQISALFNMPERSPTISQGGLHSLHWTRLGTVE